MPRQRLGTYLRRNAGLSLSEDVLAALDNLNQVKTPVSQEGWTRSYLVEQILRNWLDRPDIPADYDSDDLERVKRGRLIV
jgi:hypothetical protein